MKFLRFLFLFLLTCSLAKAQYQPELYKKTDRQQMIHWADSVFDSMTLDERIGQLFMIIADPSPQARKKILQNIREQKVGGILFAKGDLQDQAESINFYQENSRIPLWISFDGEWGLSMRLENTPRFPRNMLLGAVTDNQLIYNYGEEVARECRELGVHINFAPVLDVNNNPNNPVIGTRSFGEKPQLVSEKGIAYARGLENTGVMAVGKHFPGHGDTSEDSHKTLPVIPHTQAHLDEVELYPFVQFIQGGFSGIMTGHLLVPALDNSGIPTSLSKKVVDDFLQKKLGFRGLTFTDALVMRGASAGKESICVQALLAGNDILLSPEKPAKEFEAIKKAIQDGTLELKTIEDKCLKILQYKYIAGLNTYKAIQVKGLRQRINSAYSQWLVRKLNNEGMTLLKNAQDIIPIKQLARTKIAVLSLGADDPTAFQSMLDTYVPVEKFQIPRNAPEKTITGVFEQLKKYDLIITGVHSERISDYPALQALAAEKKVIFVFFTSPYSMQSFKRSIAAAYGVVLGYENTVYAQEAAAQLIMGGIPAKGKLPVTVPGLFAYQDGLSTEKVRLSYQEPGEAGLSAGILEKIEPIVREGIKEKAFPGCQVLIAKNGVIVYNRSFGYFDYARTHPVQNTDIYDLASVTKAAATIPAIMKLYDLKKINLQDPLSRYIPELKNTDKDDITIRSALYHQTGLISFLPFYRLAIDEQSYKGPLYSSRRDLTYRTLYDNNTYMRTDFQFKPELVSETPEKGYDLQVARNFYLKNNFSQLILKEIAQSSLKKKNTYLYSDLNFMLLKEVVENVSGRTLDTFLESEFYANLGAGHTLFKPLQRIDTTRIAPTEHDEFLRNQILIGFVDDEAAAFMGGVSGNAGLFSNANDLSKLLQLLLNDGEYGGERYLSRETCQVFTRAKSSISRRGLGFDKPDKEKPHSSPTSDSVPASVYGHTGFTGTCFWVDPDNDLIYIFLSNRVYPSRIQKKLMELNIRTRIQDVIYEAIRKTE